LAQFDAIFVTQLDQRARKLDNLEYSRWGLGVFTQAGSGIRIQRAPDSGLECAAEPTFAIVALLHLKRTAAICTVEDHLIERVNGGYSTNRKAGCGLSLATIS
jgi:hypothetical protein